MANLKISAMPGPVAVDDATIFPVVVAAFNYFTVRSLFLTDSVNQGIALQTGVSFIGLDSAGNPGCNVPAGGQISFAVGGVPVLLADPTGVVILAAIAGSKITIAGAGSSLEISSTGGVSLIDVSGFAPIITYVALNPTQWKIAPPIDMNDAIDRLANQLFNLGGVIP